MAKLNPYRDVDIAYLSCRVIRHQWDVCPRSSLPNVRLPRWGKVLTIRCIRCTAVRIDVRDIYDALRYRRYIYPNGYDLGADGSPDPALVRGAMLDRFEAGGLLIVRDDDAEPGSLVDAAAAEPANGHTVELTVAAKRAARRRAQQ